MIAALARAVGQLDDPRLLRVVVKSVIAAVLLFAGLVAALWLVLANTSLFALGWLEGAVDVLGTAAAVVIGLLLFPGVVVLVLGLFLDEAAQAVEDRHFPGLPPARRQSWLEIMASAGALVAVTVLLNLLALPLYLIPPLFPFVFYGLNGYLLGREYFELVALRRLDPAAARALRRRRSGRVFVGGVIIAILLSIPIVGWFMPVVAAAFMVHLFHRLRSGP